MEHKIVDFNALDEETKSLIIAANEVRKKSHSPYSKFPVGAALKCAGTSEIFVGCNIENSCFTPSICAERSAICVAVSKGYKKINRCVVVAHQDHQFTAPCGVCRQTLLEFRGESGDVELILAKPQMDKVLCTKLSDLLPLCFVSYENHDTL